MIPKLIKNHSLEESGQQRLENVNLTHLVLESGKQVLQEMFAKFRDYLTSLFLSPSA